MADHGNPRGSSYASHGIVDILPRGLVGKIGESPYPTLSHDFDTTDSMTMANADFAGYNTSTLAVSFWLKRKLTGGPNSGNVFFHISDVQVEINGSDKLFWKLDGATTLSPTQTFTNTSSFDHFFFIHDINQTSGNKQQIWLNGSRITVFDTVNEKTDAISSSGSLCVFMNNNISGYLYQPIIFSGGYPSAAELYNGGTPRDMRLLSNKWAALDPDNSVVSDYVLSADWTNNNVTTSTDVPF